MRVVLCLLAFFAVQATPAFAQQATATATPALSALPACDGDIAVVRVNQIKTGGTLDGFLAAVAADKAWHKANGGTDTVIVASRVIVNDPATGAWGYSNTQVITYHIHPTKIDQMPHDGDAAYSAYVKQYNDNADVTAKYITCMPKLEP
jgi:hypothetical protein